jgi:hypothetical protein
VLTAVAVIAYTRHINSARMVEAQNMIGQIQARQLTYFEQSGFYCNASGAAANFHPALIAGGEPVAKPWAPAAAGLPQWDTLGVTVPTGQVYFSYVTVAGVPPNNTLDATANALGMGPLAAGGTPEPWFYVMARGDLDNDPAAVTEFSTNSYRNKIIVKNRGK